MALPTSLSANAAALVALTGMTPFRAAAVTSNSESAKRRERGRGTPANAPRHKVGRNAPCPCGSGIKYKKCCLRAPVDPLTGLVLHDEPREYNPPKSLSEAPAVADTEFIPVTDPQFGDDAAVAAMRNAGTKPAVIYAFQKTGRFISPSSREAYDAGTLAEWDAAIKEYEEQHGQANLDAGEAVAPAGPGADAGQ